MNILYVAISCNPTNGSEDQIGWSIPFESSKTNKVWVVTAAEQKPYIENYVNKNGIKNISFIYVDIPAFYKKIFKGFFYSGRLLVWNKKAFQIIRNISKEKSIDIIHQITPVEFRAVGNYGKIPGVKFVCGPLGGAQAVPQGLRYYAKSAGIKYYLVKTVRKIINDFSRLKLRFNKRLKNCDYILFANKETQQYLKNEYKGQPNALFCDVGTKSSELLQNTENKVKHENKTVFLVVSRLIYLKGLHFLLDAASQLPDNLSYEIRIVGNGEMLDSLKKQAKASGIDDKITFAGQVPYEKINEQYRLADVFILPSIRETTGTVLTEALSNGIPVITANRFGGAVLLNDSDAWFYDGTDRQSFIESLKNAMVTCINNPDEVRKKGENALKEAAKFTWEAKMISIVNCTKDC